MKLSLSMIVKNEENNLPRCLESIKDIVDEMIIVDTGSTDETVNIAKRYGAKVYSFKWNGNFSDARNFSLDKVSGDWILIMDADDELDQNDKPKVLSLLEDSKADIYFFQTLSYIGKKPGNDLVNNINIRLVRNNMGYRFHGAIHEQIKVENPETKNRKKIEIEDIKVYHYGYLNRDIINKDKRNRNIGILKNILEENPKDSFHLFNMGNEYFALSDYEKALEYYMKSYKNFNPNIGYSPKLILRIVNTLNELERYNDELQYIKEGLRYYPKYTDLEYLRGCLFHQMGRIPSAIKSFEECIELGPPPIQLSFIDGVGGFRAYYALAETLFSAGEYDAAHSYYIKTLQAKPSFLIPLNRIAEILLYKKNIDLNMVKKKMESYFGNTLDTSAYITLSDIFYSQCKYDISLEYIAKIDIDLNELPNIQFFKGMCLFYLGEFKKANEIFRLINDSNLSEKTISKMIICESLSGNFKKAKNLINSTNEFNDRKKIIVYSSFIHLLMYNKSHPFANIAEPNEFLDVIMDLLGNLLKASAFDEFETSLQLFNLFDSNEVLLRLAKLYYRFKHYNLSYQEFLRSIKLFDKIDSEGLEMMKEMIDQKLISND
ncbi:glycosyltransferase [Sporosalibacterium faouarense]|uniref:glycosyltransferase n=1 Tax=Sporosalibacterium faouarense TaxID=516123 RepID=UPI00192C0D65|nr:TPR domain-containing glycosyltransferase [Sporosalibacterium faouarense]